MTRIQALMLAAFAIGSAACGGDESCVTKGAVPINGVCGCPAGSRLDAKSDHCLTDDAGVSDAGDGVWTSAGSRDIDASSGGAPGTDAEADAGSSDAAAGDASMDGATVPACVLPAGEQLGAPCAATCTTVRHPMGTWQCADGGAICQFECRPSLSPWS